MNENNEKMQAKIEETEEYLAKIREELKQKINEESDKDDSDTYESDESKESDLEEESQNLDQICVEDSKGNIIAELVTLPKKVNDDTEEELNEENVDDKELDCIEKEDTTSDQENMTLEELDDLLNEELEEASELEESSQDTENLESSKRKQLEDLFQEYQEESSQDAENLESNKEKKLEDLFEEYQEESLDKDNLTKEDILDLSFDEDKLLEEENNKKKKSFLQKIDAGILFVLETIAKVGIEVGKCCFGLLSFLGYTMIHPVKSFKNIFSYDNKVALDNNQNNCLSEYEIENNDIKTTDGYEDLDALKPKYNAEHDYTYTILTLTEGIKLTPEVNACDKEEILKDINGQLDDNDEKINNDTQYEKTGLADDSINLNNNQYEKTGLADMAEENLYKVTKESPYSKASELNTHKEGNNNIHFYKDLDEMFAAYNPKTNENEKVYIKKR